MAQYYVDIMSSYRRTLYVGVTRDLAKRVEEHRQKLVGGFTKRYNVTRLVYDEVAGNPMAASEREKQIKGWLRAKKVALIETANPDWADLANSIE